MNYLFTVQYALDYESWTLDPNVYPEYNSYILDEFTIKVRRNDFFLVLYITNSCGKLVFCNRIYTIYQYKRLIKKKLSSWKCQSTTSVVPVIPTNIEITPKVVNLTYNEDENVVDTLIAVLSGESFNLLVYDIVPSLNIFLSLGTNVYINGFAGPASNYTTVLLFRGIVTNTVVPLTVNITIIPSITNNIILENNFLIIKENATGNLIKE